MFYTYVHTKPDGEIFYVGKGQNKQAFRKQGRSEYWTRIVEKYGREVEILAYWETEAEAFSHEKLLISCFRDMGYKLCNMTDGGEGMSNPSKETREKLSKSRTGNKNPWFGKKHTDESILKMSKAMTGRIQNPETIAKRIKSGIYHQNFKGVVVATDIKTGEKTELFGAIDMRNKGFLHSKVSNCLHGKRKTHKGCTFTRLEI